MKIVTTELLRQVTEGARTSPRLRKNHNLHPRDDSRCHRLLNAIEPGSYIPPHRHLDPEKDEAFILMSGRLGIITFTDAGEVDQTALLSREGGNLAADIPHGVYHTAVSLEPGTVFYEAKAGPYRPLIDGERAPWAPPEGDAGATAYLERLRMLFTA
jgi:cupin fold WbuC family metalloprotein